MPDSLKKGAVGQEVRQLQELLIEKGYPVVVDGDFGNQTYRAVRAFQAQNLDQHGQPLVVDGKVGPLTWWSLNHAKVFIELPVPVDFTQMPAIEEGGSDLGRKALELAISEMNAGAREIGGNNQGPYVEKYLNSIAPAGSSWCAALVSWCFSQVDGEMPFSYPLGARESTVSTC